MTTTNFWSVNNFKCPFYSLLYSNFICSLSPLSDIMIGETFAASSEVFPFLFFLRLPQLLVLKLDSALLIWSCILGDWFLEIILGSLSGILPFEIYVCSLLLYKCHVGICTHRLTYIMVLCLCGQSWRLHAWYVCRASHTDPAVRPCCGAKDMSVRGPKGNKAVERNEIQYTPLSAYKDFTV